jgi:hypothetical protein
LSEIKWKTPVYYEQKKWNWGIFLGGCKNHQRVEVEGISNKKIIKRRNQYENIKINFNRYISAAGDNNDASAGDI